MLSKGQDAFLLGVSALTSSSEVTRKSEPIAVSVTLPSIFGW